MNNTINKPKKPTNRDVAKLAGVSIATVSYVINDRNDQRISDETRKKVLQAINFLNYSPNPHAVGLNNNSSHLITIRLPKNCSTLSKMDMISFIEELNQVCICNDFTVLFSPDTSNSKIPATACICYGHSNKDFHAFADENFIPVIAVNALIYDPVFYQVSVDYEKVATCANEKFGMDYSYVCTLPDNENLIQEIKKSFRNVAFVSSLKDINALQKNNKNIVITQPCIKDVLDLSLDLNILECFEYRKTFVLAVKKCIEQAINRTVVTDDEHYVKI